jgi:hypothetical protein
VRIGFLLGAGVSLPAGMPCTRKLTEAVLNVENYRPHSDERYYKVDLQESCDGSQDQRHLKSLLQKLECYCADYFVEQNKSRPVNYEDLFFAASQLEEHLLEEYENPAIEPFTRALLESLPGVQEREQLRDWATRVCNYIRDVVTLELRAEPTSLEHLTCLVDAMHDRDFEGCDIFTLNHDLLIEKVLSNQGISSVDGFDNRDGDVAWWKASSSTRARGTMC